MGPWAVRRGRTRMANWWDRAQRSPRASARARARMVGRSRVGAFAGPRAFRPVAGRWHLVVTGIVAIGALGQALLMPQAQAGPSVRIRGVSASMTPDGIDVSVQVANPRHERATARVWWLLAPPGKGGEWDRRAYQSAVRPLVVEAGTSTDLEWKEPVLVPEGDYVLSAWAHVPGVGGFVHASGKLAGAMVTVGKSALLRSSPPRFDMSIAGVSSTGTADDPRVVDAVVSLINTADSPRRGHVRLALGPVTAPGDPAWWRAAPAWVSGEVTVEVAAGARSEVRVRGVATVPPGQYLARATLLDPVPDLDGPIDEIGLVGSFRSISSSS